MVVALDITCDNMTCSTCDRYEFRWKNLYNWVAIITLTVETVQLSTFSFQALQASTSAADTSADQDKDGGGGYISSGLLPVMFLNAATVLKDNIHRVSDGTLLLP